ncbi:MAG: hypothetical protein ACYC8T_01115 [Myxococcaceae bacterium]
MEKPTFGRLFVGALLAGFQGLVQPMHVVVPAALVLLVPWWVRRGARPPRIEV